MGLQNAVVNRQRSLELSSGASGWLLILYLRLCFLCCRGCVFLLSALLSLRLGSRGALLERQSYLLICTFIHPLACALNLHPRLQLAPMS